MSLWEDYRKGLLALQWSLNELQTNKDGFYYPNHPDRKNISPANITRLKEGINAYSESNPAFLYFRETVSADYSSSSTSPETFQKPIYYELKSFLEKELGQI